MRQALADNPHRPAVRIVRILCVAVEHRQRHFGQLDCHAEETHDPHPEHGTRAAQGDRDSNAADVTQAYRRRQRSGQSLKVVDRARVVRVVIAATNDVNSMGQCPVLGKTAPDGEYDACPKQHEQHGVVPDNRIDCAQETIQTVHQRISARGVRLILMRIASFSRVSVVYFSTIAVTPMPPAVQTDTRPRPPPASSRSFAIVASILAPVAAKG